MRYFFFLLFLLPQISHAGVLSYDRTPSGSSFEEQEVAFNFEANGLAEYAQLKVWNGGGLISLGSCLPTTAGIIGPTLEELYLQPGEYTEVVVYTGPSADCSDALYPGFSLEYSGGSVIFTVTEAPAPSVGTTTVSALIVSTGMDMGVSFLTILAAIIGVAVGLLVIRWGWLSILNLPGGMGYDPSKGSGMSRFQRGRRNAHGGANLLE